MDAGKTILMVTHDTDLVRRVARAVRVADGEIVEEFRGERTRVTHA